VAMEGFVRGAKRNSPVVFERATVSFAATPPLGRFAMPLTHEYLDACPFHRVELLRKCWCARGVVVQPHCKLL
jgi:hypothetical protein